MLERSVSRTLGLPYCVTDCETNVELPPNVLDDIENEDLLAAMNYASHHPSQVTSLFPPVHIIPI